MAFDPHANLAYATVTTAPSPADSGLTLEIINADAAQFPDPATAGEYNCTVWAAQEIPIKSNSEIVRVTAKAAAPAPRAATHTQLTITRTQESSLARSIVVGDQLAITITKKVIDDIENNKADKITSGVEDNLVSIDDSENIKDSGLSVIDDDTMATASATTIATSESTKAYVDNGTWLKDSILRQAIINGNFDVSQRATTFVAGANNDDVYTLDHWNLISDGNDVFDVSQEAITDLPGSNYAIKLDVETAKRGGIVQFLEAKDAQKFKGKTVSISFAVKSANISALRATVLSWSGTADSITSDVVGTWGATPTWATNWADNATPADLTVTSSWTTVKVEGIVLDEATVNNLALVIWTPNEETIGDIVYITQVQMNEGSKALPFMPKSYEEELRACMRYYETCYGYGFSPASTLDTGSAWGIANANNRITVMCNGSFKVQKRTVTPAVTIYNYGGTANKVGNADNSNAIGTSVTVQRWDDKAIQRLQDSGTGFTANALYWFGWVANNEL